MPDSCNPMDCGLPGSFVHGILQARMLEWVAISFSRRSSWPRNLTQVSCIAGRFFTSWAMREALYSVIQLCPTLCKSIDCSSLGSPVHGIFPARILEWTAISSSRGSSWPRDWTHISCISCIGRWILYRWATWESLSLTLLLFSCSVISDSLGPHGLQHTRPPCPSPSPEVCSNSCPLPRFMSIQPFHSMTPSSPALNLSQYQGLLQLVDCSHQMTRILELQL